MPKTFVLPLSHDEVVHGKKLFSIVYAGRCVAYLPTWQRLLWLDVGLPGKKTAIYGE